MPRPDAAHRGEAGARPLLDALHQKAEAEAQARRTAAADEASRIRADSDAHRARRVATATAERTSTLSARQEATRAECLQRLARETLTARAEALERVFTAASTRIEERQGHSGLATALGTMIAEALTYLPDGPAQVRCSRESVPTVRQAVASLEREGLRVSEDDTVSLGVVAESGDGAIVVNATFARRLARERPRLAIEIMGQLDRAPA